MSAIRFERAAPDSHRAVVLDAGQQAVIDLPDEASAAVLGAPGSGKTTVVNLLPRIYDAAPGTLLIDGRPIREYPL